MEMAELAFIPAPGAGHLAPVVEFAKALTSRDHRVSVTVFIMQLPYQSKLNIYIQSLLSNQPPQRMRFVHLTLDEPTSEYLRSKPHNYLMNALVEVNKSRVRDFYSSKSTQHGLSAFVVDMFCTGFADVASEHGIPHYVFFTCNARVLSLMFYLQSLHDDENQDVTEFKDSDIELTIPGFVNLLPAKVLPSAMFDKENGGFARYADVPRKLRKTKGILVNTFTELESYTIKCFSKNGTLPPIYAVGPVLNLRVQTAKYENDLGQYGTIMTWLDNQPLASVVLLCFGSMGTFEAEQVVEIARALEQSKHRFLWVLRKPPTKETLAYPLDYENFNEVLPEGFLDRTKEIGKVIGWVPQVAVLSHPSVGGFVSHCGWNAIMESIWCGVPMATWPLDFEQQINAFTMVKELELAVDIKLDYHKENPIVLSAKEIERGIKQLMEDNESTKIKKKVKAMSEEARRATTEGGTSYAAIEHVIEEILNRSP